MNLVRMRLRESRDLWLIVSIAVVLGIHVVAVNTFGRSSGPVASIAVNSLAVWLCGLLWIAYRRWRAVAVREDELNDIIFSLNPIALLVVDPDWRIVMCNGAIRTLFGRAPEDVVGNKTDLLYEDRRSIDLGQVSRRLKEAGFHLGRAAGQTVDGTAFPIEVFTCQLHGRRGAVVLVKDISDIVAAEVSLRQALDHAEAANGEKEKLLGEVQRSYEELQRLQTMRDDLVHMIVHDMKSPLQSVLGYLQLLQIRNGGLIRRRPEAVRFVDRALQEAQRLSSMVDTTLDVSRLETGQMPLKCRVVDMLEIVHRALEGVEGIRGEREIRVIAQDGGVDAKCDPEILERVLLNLVSNAIRFTEPTQRINVTVSWEKDTIRFDVSDPGEGIAPVDHERIFEKFESAETEESRKRSTGIGLAFCRLAVEAHGGRIGVVSDIGEGSTFWLTLPRGGPPLDRTQPVGPDMGEMAVTAPSVFASLTGDGASPWDDGASSSGDGASSSGDGASPSDSEEASSIDKVSVGPGHS